MEYAVVFFRRIDDRAEEMALGIVSLVADGIAGIVAAEALYRTITPCLARTASASATAQAKSSTSLRARTLKGSEARSAPPT